jgi:leucyl/phenylalanyl-tRNA--protein transferase
MLGVFPMAETRGSDQVFWVEPDDRGILPLPGFHTSRSLQRRVNAGADTCRYNVDFRGVVRACADRDETWINATLEGLYLQLHALGYAHSCEIYAEDKLVGGVFGIAIKGAFFGESMFSTATDASKTALKHLTTDLHAAGFALFDTQFVTDHLISLGAKEIPKAAYLEMLEAALKIQPSNAFTN